HAERRVAHAFGIAIADRDRGGLARFEDDPFCAVGSEHTRARDLDLLRAPARAELAAGRALALLLFADLLVIRVDDVVGRPFGGENAIVEPDRALAEARDRSQVVRDEHDRLLGRPELA